MQEHCAVRPIKRLRAAVVGAGKFGRHHASKYAAMNDVDLVGIVDSDLKAAKKLAQELGCRAFYNVDTIIGRVDLVSVATPATTHRTIAVRLLEAGIHVYVEKPLACTLEDADAILRASTKHKGIVAVGHQERYILNRLYLNAQETPQVIECHRLNTWTGRATDVDVALDLMIHDVDLVLQLASGSLSISSSSGHGLRSCNNTIKADLKIGPCTARLEASRNASRQTRTMRVQYSTGSVFIDFVACHIEDTRPITLKAKFSDLINGADGVTYDPLGLAISDFVRCVHTGQEPFVNGRDGRRALAVTLDLLCVPQVSQQPIVPIGPSNILPIPLFDLESSALRLRADIDRRIAQVLNHRRYIDGPEVSALESALAAYTGSKYCLTCSSGTAALTIALMGENLSKRDAVFLPVFTYNATCNAIITAGATPIFVDVDRSTCTICPRSLERAIAATMQDAELRPAVVIGVDLYGQPALYADLNRIAARYKMVVLADAAQSLGGSQSGRKVGSLTDMTATSFYPSKTLGGFGDGGAIFTDDTERYERWKSIRWHGTDESRGESVRVGLNGRLDSLQCAVLLAKLGVFEEEMDGRKRVAKWYRRALGGQLRLQTGDIDGHANGLFTIILNDSKQRVLIREALQAAGISSGVYYAKPLHRHKAFQSYLRNSQHLPNADWLADRVLSLPMSPCMLEEEVIRVANVVCRLFPAIKSGQLAEARL